MGKRKIAILGSTGSIGTQALDVIRQHRDLFEVELISANRNVDILTQQALEDVCTPGNPKPVTHDEVANIYRSLL